MTDKPSLLIHGMHGLGDCIHQRAIIRALLKRGNRIALETSWPCVYYDLAGEDLKFIRKPVALRTQLKNAEREADKFVPGPPPHHGGNSVHISYNRASVANRSSHTILEAMFAAAGILGDYAEADYRLPPRPFPDQWIPVFETTKPIMIYRPLVVRPEWRGSGIRNANPDQYAELVAMVRDSFYVVSVADLEPNREWIVGPQLVPDTAYHHGELSFESLADLFRAAALVFTSSGFPAILGPAVETPTISIQGGFEPASWHNDGARFAPYLGINPINPCICATSACSKPCLKALDMPAARAAVTEFIAKLGVSAPAESRPLTEMFTPSTAPTPPQRSPARPLMARGRQLRPGNPALLNRRPGIRA